MTAILKIKVFCFRSTVSFRVRRPIQSINTMLIYCIFTDLLRVQINSRLLSQWDLQQPQAKYRVSDKLSILEFRRLPTQRKIAAVLSAYDDLIENNTRRIKILEEMASAIYREWFVEFRFPDMSR